MECGSWMDRPSGLGTYNKRDKGPYIAVPISCWDSSQVLPLGRGLDATKAMVEDHDWRICRLWKRARVIHRARHGGGCGGACTWYGRILVGLASAGRSTKQRLGAKRTAQAYPPWPLLQDRHCDMSEQPRRRASKRPSRRCDVVPQCLNINHSNSGAGIAVVIGP